jgi:hypothetical protein
MLNHNTLTTLKVATNLFRCFKCNELCNSSARLQPPNNTLKPQRVNGCNRSQLLLQDFKKPTSNKFQNAMSRNKTYLAGTKE